MKLNSLWDFAFIQTAAHQLQQSATAPANSVQGRRSEAVILRFVFHAIDADDSGSIEKDCNASLLAP